MGSIQWNNAQLKCYEAGRKNTEEFDSTLGWACVSKSNETAESRKFYKQLSRKVTVTSYFIV